MVCWALSPSLLPGMVSIVRSSVMAGAKPTPALCPWHGPTSPLLVFVRFDAAAVFAPASEEPPSKSGRFFLRGAVDGIALTARSVDAAAGLSSYGAVALKSHRAVC